MAVITAMVHDDNQNRELQLILIQIRQAITDSNYDQAERLSAPIIENGSKCQHAWQYWVQIAYRKKQFKTAERRVSMALEIHPRHRTLHILSARIQKSLGNTEKANVQVDRALERWPMATDLLCLKLDLLSGVSQKKQALSLLKALRKESSLHPAVLMAMARWYQSHFRFEAAHVVVTAILAKYPSHENALMSCRELTIKIAQQAINKGKFSKADKVLSTAIESKAYNPVIWRLWVQAAIHQELIELSNERIHIALKRRPNDPELYTLNVRINMAMGQPAKALEIAETGLDQWAMHSGLCCVKLDLLRLLGMKTQAFSLLRAIFKQDASSSGVLMAAARFYQANNRIKSAINVLKRLLAEQPQHQNALKLEMTLRANQINTDMSSELASLFNAANTQNSTSNVPPQVLLHTLSLINLAQTDKAKYSDLYQKVIVFLLDTHWKKTEQEKLQLLSQAERLGAEREVNLAIAKICLRGPESSVVATALLDRAISSEIYHSIDSLIERLTKYLPVNEKRNTLIDFMLRLHGPQVALTTLKRKPNKKRGLDEARRLCELLKLTDVHALGQRYIRFCRRRWPKDFELKSLQALMLLNSGNPQQALEILDDNIPIAKRIAAANLRAQCLLELGRGEDAQKTLEDSGVRGTTQLLMTRIRLLIMLGRADDARHIITQAQRSGLQHEITSEHFSISMIGVHLNDLNLYTAEKEQLEGNRYEHDLVARYNYAATRTVMQRTRESIKRSYAHCAIPRRIVQYWDSANPPESVVEIMDSWSDLPDTEYHRFNSRMARKFIREIYGKQYERAFTLANNPAEGADFFRLCYLRYHGGVYVDADDRFHGELETLFPEGVGLLCFREGFGALANNVISTMPGHPAIVHACEMAAEALLSRDNESTWSKTGPGLLTRAVACYLVTPERKDSLENIQILPNYMLRRSVQIHMELPHKKTKQYWNASKSNNFDIRWLIERQ